MLSQSNPAPVWGRGMEAYKRPCFWWEPGGPPYHLHPHCSEVTSAPSPWVCACSGLQGPRLSLPEKPGGVWGEEAEPVVSLAQRVLWLLCLLPVVLVREGPITWLDNEMTQVGSPKLFQRGLRKEKAGHIAKILKKHLERCRSPSSTPPHGGPSATGQWSVGTKVGILLYCCRKRVTTMALPTLECGCHLLR